MKSIFCFMLSVSLLLAIGTYNVAAELTIVQKNALSNLVVDINKAMKNKNFSIIAAHMSDRLYREIARRLNATEDSLRNNFLEQLHMQFANLSTDAYHLDEKEIDYQQINNDIFYALIPTVIETKDRIIKYKTLAIFDNGKWFLVYGGQKTIQNTVFLEIYPDFKGINMPKETVIEK
ncbi:hypothetical protein [Bartonella rochalimae]|uniref:Uncharacterized protein n=1 Tax=Bartonella rochalimae ATCC BAA-1498 TaxID=685782 RepID=E6YME3_9HYPH|nr:hypothetical protein [Bartonella rochalimae]KEC57017.1 hypothetical protein O99_00439 [Bartonella rochalimae ATCC BAA-1498]CBI78045.1 conserved exported hypothetical protein [Bartonella rochalimae ATCC BAA-1498]